MTPSPSMSSGARAFDFLLGAWNYRLRRLAGPLDPSCSDWTENEATGVAFSILDGLGNIDRLYVPEAETSEAFEGLTLRLYEPDTDQWRIWWVSTKAPGVFDEPVVGRFADGVGVFECDDTVNGEPVRVRYTWHPNPDEPRFEQSFSRDGGSTWWTNWVTIQRRP
jgi:hypothetical protein